MKAQPIKPPITVTEQPSLSFKEIVLAKLENISKTSDPNTQWKLILDFQNEFTSRKDEILPYLKEIGTNTGIKDDRYRTLGILLIGLFKFEKGVDVLREILDDVNPKIRSEAISSLTQYPSSNSAFGLVIEHLRDPDISVQESAIHAMWHFRGKEAIKELDKRLSELNKKHPLKRFIEQVTISIMPMILRDIGESLGTISQNKDLNKQKLLRAELLKTQIEFCGIDRIKNVLADIVLHRNYKSQNSIRVQALYSLKEIGGNEAIETLIDSLNSNQV